MMGVFDNLFSEKSKKPDLDRELIEPGAQNKADADARNHQTNKGDARTRAQKEDDKKREKND